MDTRTVYQSFLRYVHRMETWTDDELHRHVARNVHYPHFAHVQAARYTLAVRSGLSLPPHKFFVDYGA